MIAYRAGEIIECDDGTGKIVRTRLSSNKFGMLNTSAVSIERKNLNYNFDLADMDTFSPLAGPGKNAWLGRNNIHLPTNNTDLHLAASKQKEIKLKLYINPVVDGKPYYYHKLVDMNGSPLPSSVLDLTVNADKAKLTRPMTVPQNSILRPKDGDPEVVIFHTSAYVD